MVAYSFKKQFIEPIRLGLKHGPTYPGAKMQTIRAIGKRRHARTGETLQLYHAMRTLQCFKIDDALCAVVRSIMIKPEAGFIAIDHDQKKPERISSIAALNAFATRDGFENFEQMREFWNKEHPGVTDFVGVLIPWGPLT